jgi:hypothetical protein
VNELALRTLVARQVGALRAKSYATVDALELVLQHLPPGAVRTTCEQAAQQLRSGAAPAVSGDPLGSALARADSAGAELWQLLADSLDAEAAANAGIASTASFLRLAALAPAVLGGYAAVRASAVGGSIPWSVASYAGLALAAVGLLLTAWLARRYNPGRREAALALQLYGVAVQGKSELPALQLRDEEHAWLTWRMARAGLPVAARELADELSRVAARKREAFGHLAPVAGALVVFGLFTTQLTFGIIRVFAIAGSIK